MKSTDDYYLLEELGQSFNETLVTKLLTIALNHSEPFTAAFVNVCKTPMKNIQKVVAISEVQFTNKKNRIDILLLIQNGTNVELFIIENKLFAGEGAEQATRYYDAVTNGGEVENLKQKYGFKGDNQVHFIYLTLLGDQASNNNFISVTYEDVFQFLNNGNVVDDTLSYQVLKNYLTYLHIKIQPQRIALNELISIKELQLYVDQFKIETPLGKQIRKSYFEIMLQELTALYQKDFEFEKEFPSSSANGMMKVSWRKDNWLSSSDILQRDDFQSNHRIVLQSSFIPNNDTIHIEIHYETQPYYPQSQLKNQIQRGVISKQNENAYRRNREAFVDLFHEKRNATKWPDGVIVSRRNTALTFAVVKIPIILGMTDNLQNDTFDSLAKRIGTCSQIVNQTVEQAWAELSKNSVL